MNDIQIDTLVLGPLMTNCYVLRSGLDCWIVDPSLFPLELLEFLQDQNLVPSKVLLTHGHGDHIAGVNELRELFDPLVVACTADDAPMLTDARLNMSADFGMALTIAPADELIKPGQVLTCGRSQWQVLDTSGHTPGGVSFYCAQAGVVITGDALFAQSIGRCDLPNADMDRLVNNIKKNLLGLPPQTRVLCGHGDETTIGRELQNNPYLGG